MKIDSDTHFSILDGDYDAAIKHYKARLRKLDSSPEIQVGLGHAYMARGARKHYEAVVAFRVGNSIVRSIGAKARASIGYSKDYLNAIKCYRKAFNERNSDKFNPSLLCTYVARAYRALGDFQNASWEIVKSFRLSCGSETGTSICTPSSFLPLQELGDITEEWTRGALNELEQETSDIPRLSLCLASLFDPPLSRSKKPHAGGKTLGQNGVTRCRFS